MTRTLDYINDPPFAEEVSHAPSDADWTSILRPGDLLLARGSGNMVSKLIQRTDGFFTHSAVYLGSDQDGVGWLAHAYSMGIQLWDLDKLRVSYTDGVGWARPGYGEERNVAAAEWAKSFARPADDKMLPYDYGDLGLSFAIMMRAMWRRGRDMIDVVSEAEIDELFNAADEVFASRPPDEFEPSSCSAYVWRAYHEGADRAIVPEFIHGVRVQDGRLKSPHAALAAKRSIELSALGERMRQKWHILSAMTLALPGAAALFDSDRGAILSEIVTPGDLWCSPSMVARGRLA